MRKLIIITSAVMPAIAVLCTALYLRGGQDVFLTLAITFATISYHFIMRLIVGGIVNSTMHNRADLSRPWFRQRDWERKLYRLLRVKKWKGRVPAYRPDFFDLSRHTPDEIAQAMCQAEITHEIILPLSFLPIFASIWVGALPAFVITSVISAGACIHSYSEVQPPEDNQNAGAPSERSEKKGKRKMTNTKKFRNCLLLLTAAIIWGMAFVSQQAGMDFMGPLTFNGSRNIIGSVILVPVILIIRGRIPKAERKPLPVKTTIIGGLACGAALTIASTLQQYGLTMTTVGKGGFITTLYIILTPILGIFIGRKAPKAVWFCAVLAVAGMFLLCVNGESLSISAGDLLVLGSALVFAVHILVIDHFSPLTDGVILSCIQFAVCGVVSTIGAFIFEQPSWEQLVSGAIPVLYAGVLSCGVGYTLQIVGQKGVDPTAAALILSLESVVATISGFVAYKIGFLRTDQSMSPRQIIGCAIVFAAVILVQLPWDRISRKLRKNQNA